MENKYWLDRERSSLGMARAASSSRARLVHYELAGLYSVKAVQATQSSRLSRRLGASLIIASTKSRPHHDGMTPDQFYYSCLEQGARYLADRAKDRSEREEHLQAGDAYAAKAEEAAQMRQTQHAR